MLISCALGIKRAPATWEFFIVTTSIFLSILEETKEVSSILQVVSNLKLMRIFQRFRDTESLKSSPLEMEI